MIHVNRYPLPAVDAVHRRALHQAATMLVEQAFDALAASVDPEQTELDPFANVEFLTQYLPPKHRPRYSPYLLRSFAVSIIIVGWKLTEPDNVYPLSNVLEELALNAMLACAADIAQTDAALDAANQDDDAAGGAWELAELREVLFEDEDFAFLFEGRLDGIETDPRVQARLPMANLAFPAWQKPFNPRRHVHPFVDQHGRASWQRCWARNAPPDDLEGDDRVRPAIPDETIYEQCAHCAQFVMPWPDPSAPDGLGGFIHLSADGGNDHPPEPSGERKTLRQWLSGSRHRVRLPSET